MTESPVIPTNEESLLSAVGLPLPTLLRKEILRKLRMTVTTVIPTKEESLPSIADASLLLATCVMLLPTLLRQEILRKLRMTESLRTTEWLRMTVVRDRVAYLLLAYCCLPLFLLLAAWVLLFHERW